MYCAWRLRLTPNLRSGGLVVTPNSVRYTPRRLGATRERRAARRIGTKRPITPIVSEPGFWCVPVGTLAPREYGWCESPPAWIRFALPHASVLAVRPRSLWPLPSTQNRPSRKSRGEVLRELPPMGEVSPTRIRSRLWPVARRDAVPAY